jgi:hypothetical protein
VLSCVLIPTLGFLQGLLLIPEGAEPWWTEEAIATPRGNENAGRSLSEPIQISLSTETAEASLGPSRPRLSQSSATRAFRYFWYDDEQAALILKASSEPPTNAGNFPGLQVVTVFPMLAPAEASTRLLELGQQLSLDGVSSIAPPQESGGGTRRIQHRRYAE